jgi:alpha-beta hydrolase superfamily lysophospholipase
LIGFSLGGNLSLGYVLDERPQPDLLILSAPALDGGAAWLRAVAPLAARVAPRFGFPNPWKGEHLSRDPEVVERYYRDPLVHTRSTLRFGAQFLDAMELCNERMGQLDIPTLVLHGGDDRLVPTNCSEPLGELAVVDRKVYEGLRHEIINEPEGPEVVADIVAWIDEHLGLQTSGR